MSWVVERPQFASVGYMYNPISLQRLLHLVELYFLRYALNILA